MKIKMLLMALGIMASATALASTSVSNLESCKAVGAWATSAMEARQRDADLFELYSIADGDELLILLIEDAYDYPFYHGTELKRRTVIDFSNKWSLACMSSLRGD
jgi:hypothetical protein